MHQYSSDKVWKRTAACKHGHLHAWCFIESYLGVWGLSEIHWVMLTLAPLLTSRQSSIKRVTLSARACIPSKPVLCSVRGVCEGEPVYLLHIWVRGNLLCVRLCYKHSSCSSQGAQSLMTKTQLYTTRISIQDKSVQMLRKIRPETVFKDVYGFTWW